MSNDLKVKVLMVAAVEANTAAEAQERLAELRINGINNPPEPHFDAAAVYRTKARKCIQRAAELAELDPVDLALLEIRA